MFKKILKKKFLNCYDVLGNTFTKQTWKNDFHWLKHSNVIKKSPKNNTTENKFRNFFSFPGKNGIKNVSKKHIGTLRDKPENKNSKSM